MSTTLRCTTPAVQIRSALRAGHRQIKITFEFHDNYFTHVFTVMSMRPDAGEVVRLACLLPSANSITLLLPPESDSCLDVVVDRPVEASTLVMAEARGSSRPPTNVLWLEKYVCHQFEMMFGDVPVPVDDGPYAQHPALHDLPLAARMEIDDAVSAGLAIKAIAILRHSRPSLSLVEAHVIIKALQALERP